MATVTHKLPTMTESDATPIPPVAGAPHVRWRRSRRVAAWTGSCFEWLAGLAGLIIGLSILATIPILQFVSLGYLLESGSRVIKSGRLRDGFPGVRFAAKLATVGIAGWLLLLPVRAVADLQYSAELLGNSTGAERLGIGFFVLLFVVAAHFLSACWRGSRLRSFLWPAPIWLFRRLRAGGLWQSSRDTVFDAFRHLELPRLFWLGARGFFCGRVVAGGSHQYHRVGNSI